jgi:hypothetical protein
MHHNTPEPNEEPCGKTAGYLNVRNFSLSYSLANPAENCGECARYPFHQDPVKYNQIVSYIEEVFHVHRDKLQTVKELAHRIKEGLQRISPFIQQSVEAVCPGCPNVCCINKHGYYNYEDIVYIYALGLKIHDYDFGEKDSTPCQFLSEKGCIMERSVRPSGCNWYFCEPLLDHMEKRPDYWNFDNDLKEVVEVWLELMDEFDRVIKE